MPDWFDQFTVTPEPAPPAQGDWFAQFSTLSPQQQVTDLKLRQAKVGPAPTWADTAVDALPTIGAMVGAPVGAAVGAMGGGIGAVPGGIAGAGGGAALGKWGQQRLRRLQGRSDVPDTITGRLAEIGASGTGQAALEATGAGTAKMLTRGSRFFMNSALRPGLRLMDNAGKPLTGPGQTLSARFPQTDIIGEALRRKIPIRNRGLRETQASLEAARGAAMDAVETARTARPPVAGLLPEGRRAVALGEIPVPTGGRPVLSPSHAIQRVPENAQRARQGLSSGPAVTPFYGATPAANAARATADTVTGPGTISLPMSHVRNLADIAREGDARLIPGRGQMIGIDEALQPASATRAAMTETALPKEKRVVDKLLSDYRAEYPRPVDLGVGQRRKEAGQEAAARLFRTGKGPRTAQFQQDLAGGYQQAIERRVPGIKTLNTETQTQLALREALLTALDKESRSSRFTVSGLLDNPRLWGTVAHTARRGATAAKIAPQLGRAALISLMASHQTPR